MSSIFFLLLRFYLKLTQKILHYTNKRMSYFSIFGGFRKNSDGRKTVFNMRNSTEKKKNTNFAVFYIFIIIFNILSMI